MRYLPSKCTAKLIHNMENPNNKLVYDICHCSEINLGTFYTDDNDEAASRMRIS